MTHARMAEAAINASLDAHLHGAQHGDVNQARCLHDLLDKMLTEQETDEGRLWLTEHGKMLLELCQQNMAESEQDLNAAVSKVVESGDYDLDAARILDIYEKIADTVGGFREMTRC